MNRILERLQQKPQVTRLDDGVKVRIAKKKAPVKIADVKIVDNRGKIDRAAIMARLAEPAIKVSLKPKDEIQIPKDEIPKEAIPKEEIPKEAEPIVVVEKPEEADPVVVVEKPEEEETIIIKPKGKRKTKKLIIEGEEGEPKKRRTRKKKLQLEADKSDPSIQIGDLINVQQLPKTREKVIVKASAYYLNNRKVFVNFINNLFSKYRAKVLEEAKLSGEEGKDIVDTFCNKSDDAKSKEFELLTHQKIVRDYINIYSPYRGLLLYHGLGSGKTCSSIAIAEGLKSERQIIVMTPASLSRNYRDELKNCGDPFYKKSQHWSYINLEGKMSQEVLREFNAVLSVPMDYIKRKKGVWMVDARKPANFEQLSAEQKRSLDDQLDKMIAAKYKFINYNGLRNAKLNEISKNGTVNPFDNSVVIIDESHNFVSRIVNKLRDKNSLSMRLYEMLMSAKNARIVFLSGTPIINYPNEVGIMFNILRGYIKTYRIPVDVKSGEKVNEEKMKSIISKSTVGQVLDYVSYKPSTGVLTVTKNPFGFVNSFKEGLYKGVKLGDEGQISDEDMMTVLQKLLKQNKIEVNEAQVSEEKYKALPDSLEEFQEFFVETGDKKGTIKNKQMFQRRILGLTSYFRSAREELMPQYDESKDLQVINIEMSKEQFEAYEEARVAERKLETQNKKKSKGRGKGKGKDGQGDLYKDSVSTYRIFSRLFCNYVFPKKLVARPMPKEGDSIDTAIEKGDEDVVDAVTSEERLDNIDGRFLADELETLKRETEIIKDYSYEKRIQNAIDMLRDNGQLYLTPEALATYSPKYLKILEAIQNVDNVGLHLIYSQFRTLEGIGIFKLVLEANGYAELKVKRDADDQWQLDVAPEDMDKPKFVLYTGKEEQDAKEIVRHIYNSNWDKVPASIVEQLKKIAPNNYLGEIAKIFMITASGAEGIDLSNCRFVHIMEPYWHPVRVEQVIGRARRICSHKNLPPELRNVKVFIYLMTFSEELLKSDISIELRLKDKGKKDKNRPLTSDEALYEIATIKQDINKQLLMAVKEAAFDCAIYSTADSKEPLVCFSFGDVKDPEDFAFVPSLRGEEKNTVAKVNLKKITWAAKAMTIKGKKYALRADTGEVYDYDSYIQARKTPGVKPVLVGKLTIGKDGKKKFTSL